MRVRILRRSLGTSERLGYELYYRAFDIDIIDDIVKASLRTCTTDIFECEIHHVLYNRQQRQSLYQEAIFCLFESGVMHSQETHLQRLLRVGRNWKKCCKGRSTCAIYSKLPPASWVLLLYHWVPQVVNCRRVRFLKQIIGVQFFAMCLFIRREPMGYEFPNWAKGSTRNGIP